MNEHPVAPEPSDHPHLTEQRRRFDHQSAAYSTAHGHLVSQQYRDRFIRRYVLDGVVDGARVLDAMCGGGEETGYLLEHGAIVQGLDISSANADAYTERWNLPCRVASITDSGFPDEHFDVVYICGGLHHIRPLLAEAVDECWRVLKPGGYFVVVEPNADSWTDVFRRVWYRIDRRFARGEGAISIRRDLAPLVDGRFAPDVVHEGGGIAYLLVAQAFIVRTPERLRSRLAAILFAIESALGRTPLNPRFFVCARFTKPEEH